jgi:hypothetical protein
MDPEENRIREYPAKKLRKTTLKSTNNKKFRNASDTHVLKFILK